MFVKERDEREREREGGGNGMNEEKRRVGLWKRDDGG